MISNALQVLAFEMPKAKAEAEATSKSKSRLSLKENTKEKALSQKQVFNMVLNRFSTEFSTWKGETERYATLEVNV